MLRKIEDWLKPDKSLHITVSTFLVVALFGITRSMIAAALVTIAIGLAKEYVVDGIIKKGAKSVQDIYADLIGTAIGLVYTGYVSLVL